MATTESWFQKLVKMFLRLLSKMGVNYDNLSFHSSNASERVVGEGKVNIITTGTAPYVKTVPHEFNNPVFIEFIISKDDLTYEIPLEMSYDRRILAWSDKNNLYFATNNGLAGTKQYVKYTLYWNDLYDG